MRFLLYKTLKDKRRLGKIAVFNCILYDASRRMANKLLFYSILLHVWPFGATGCPNQKTTFLTKY